MDNRLIIRTESRTVAAVIFLWGLVLFSSSPVFLAHGLINVKVVSSKSVFEIGKSVKRVGL